MRQHWMDWTCWANTWMIGIRFAQSSVTRFLACALAGLLCSPLSQHALGQDLVLQGGWVFDTPTKSFRVNRGLVIRNGKFTADHQSPAVVQIHLTDNHYILPGLVDCHAHYNVRLNGRRRRDETQVQPVVYLANGVTTTFSAGEYDPEAMRECRLAIESGQQLGPRLINSGPYFGSVRPGWSHELTAEQVFADVDHWVRMGAGAFKAKGIRAPQLEALIQRAHFHGKSVTAHLESGYRDSVNPMEAITLGIDRIEHFLGGNTLDRERSAYSTLGGVSVDTPEFREIVSHFLKNEVFFDATLTAYGYFGLREEGYDYWVDESRYFTPWVQSRVAELRKQERKPSRYDAIYWNKRKTVKAFFDAGGQITMGTDHVSEGEFLPGFSAHRELDALVRSGIPAADAIIIGTLNGAKALGLGDQIGSIEAGKQADFLVVEGNPLKDIKNTRNVVHVGRDGMIYRSAKLLQVVEGKLGPADPTQAKSW